MDIESVVPALWMDSVMARNSFDGCVPRFRRCHQQQRPVVPPEYYERYYLTPDDLKRARRVASKICRTSRLNSGLIQRWRCHGTLKVLSESSIQRWRCHQQQRPALPFRWRGGFRSEVQHFAKGIGVSFSGIYLE